MIMPKHYKILEEYPLIKHGLFKLGMQCANFDCSAVVITV